MPQTEIFIARQPIFDQGKRVVGYELLYRNSAVNRFDTSVDGSTATKRVITEALLNFGMDALTEGQQGYVNFTEELLLEGMPQLLDKKDLISSSCMVKTMTTLLMTTLVVHVFI